MAVTKERIKTAYQFPAYNYRVEIGSDTVALSEVSGLEVVIDKWNFPIHNCR